MIACLVLFMLCFTQTAFSAKQYEISEWALDLVREKERTQQKEAFLKEQQDFHARQGEAAINKQKFLATQKLLLLSDQEYRKLCDEFDSCSTLLRVSTQKMLEIDQQRKKLLIEVSAWLDVHNAIVFHSKAS